MSRIGHTRTTKNRRVRVTLKDGTVLCDRFVERARSKRWIVLQRHGRVMMNIISSMSDHKGL